MTSCRYRPAPKNCTSASGKASGTAGNGASSGIPCVPPPGSCHSLQPIAKTAPQRRALQRIFQPAEGVKCARLMFTHAGHSQCSIPTNRTRGRCGNCRPPCLLRPTAGFTKPDCAGAAAMLPIVTPVHKDFSMRASGHRRASRKRRRHLVHSGGWIDFSIACGGCSCPVRCSRRNREAAIS
jgi:hypothetical protein